MAPPALRSSLALVAAAVVATVQCVAAGPPQHGYNDNSKLTRRGYKRHFGRQGIEMDMTLIHAKVGTLAEWPLNPLGMVGMFKFQSDVTEDLTVGGTLATNGQTKGGYVRYDFGKARGRAMTTEANVQMEGEDKLVGTLVASVEVDDDTHVKAHVKHDGTTWFEVNHSPWKRGWTFNPSLNLKTKKAGMMASARIEEDTHMEVHVRGDGRSSFEVIHDVDDRTSVKVSVGHDKMALEGHWMMGPRTLMSPSIDASKREFLLKWTHKLDDVYDFRTPDYHHKVHRNRSRNPGRAPLSEGGRPPTTDRLEPYRHGRRVTAKLVPTKYASVEFESDDEDDWAAALSVPWKDFESGRFKSSTMTLSRKFDM